jgi:hypothetical protein
MARSTHLNRRRLHEMMRFILGIALAAFVGATASAQVETKTTDTKVKVKDGKDVQMTGCVEVTSGPAAYMLTNALMNGKNGTAVHNYYLVGDTGGLKSHVGHMMEIKGKVSDRGDAKIEVKTETKIDREHADDTKTERKTEIKGDLAGAPLPFLDVSSVKMLRASCNVS